jgi:hypothetical protein
MGEYALLISSLAGLFSSLSVVYSSIQLPLTASRAAPLVAAAAKAHNVAGPQASAAYKSAPFTKPALRYLYSVGWVQASSNVSACKAALVFSPDPTPAVTQAISKTPVLQARLRAAHIPASVAASAIARGYVAGCN